MNAQEILRILLDFQIYLAMMALTISKWLFEQANSDKFYAIFNKYMKSGGKTLFITYL